MVSRLVDYFAVVGGDLSNLELVYPTPSMIAKNKEHRRHFHEHTPSSLSSHIDESTYTTSDYAKRQTETSQQQQQQLQGQPQASTPSVESEIDGHVSPATNHDSQNQSQGNQDHADNSLPSLQALEGDSQVPTTVEISSPSTSPNSTQMKEPSESSQAFSTSNSPIDSSLVNIESGRSKDSTAIEGREVNIHAPVSRTDEDSEATFQADNALITSISQLQFKPCLLNRYPLKDYKDSSLSAEIPMFCLPESVQITTECEMPRFFTFILTGADGSKVYCSTLWFFEYVTDKSCLENIIDRIFEKRPTRHTNSPDISEGVQNDGERGHRYTSSDNLELDQLRDSNPEAQVRKQLQQTLYISKAITIVSHYPLFSTCKKFLTQLYRIHLTPSSIPIERWICNFCSEVPLPPRGRASVQYNLGPDRIIISRPQLNHLPLLDVPVHHVFLSLDIQNILIVFNCILTEQKILFHSKHYSLLGTVSEFFLSSIYPFEWWHVYIPILPRNCTEFIEAPMPFIMGVHSSYLPTINIPSDVIVVDLDENVISTKNPNRLKMNKLPEKQHKKLYDMLTKLKIKESLAHYNLENIDSAFNMAPTPEEAESMSGERIEFPQEKIRMTFFRFFVSLFQKYRAYMVKGNESVDSMGLDFDADAVFKKAQFIKDQSPLDRPFVRMLLETQAFYQFLFQRTVDNNTPEIRFFDESIQAKINRSKLTFHKKDTPFLNDHSYDNKTTSVALTPLTSDLPEGKIYHHETFPDLNPDLYYTPRDIVLLVKPDDVVSMKNAIVASWKPIIKQLNILQQELGRQQRLKISNDDFNEAIKVSKSTLRRDHTRSVSVGNMDYVEFEQNLSESSDNNTPSKTVNFGGAQVWFAQADSQQLKFSVISQVFDIISLGDNEVCPSCGRILTNRQIRMGWSNDVQDYRITCRCSLKFVPRFSVMLDATKLSANGKLRIFMYEFLSPGLLRKEVENLIKNGVPTDANLLQNHARIFWNLILHFRDLKIPLNYLLPFLDWDEVSKVIQSIALSEEIREDEFIPKNEKERMYALKK